MLELHSGEIDKRRFAYSHKAIRAKAHHLRAVCLTLCFANGGGLIDTLSAVGDPRRGIGRQHKTATLVGERLVPEVGAIESVAERHTLVVESHLQLDAFGISLCLHAEHKRIVAVGHHVLFAVDSLPLRVVAADISLHHLVVAINHACALKIELQCIHLHERRSAP